MAARPPATTATSTETARAASQGSPAAWAWPKVVAPMAANAIWHSEICPDVHSNSPSEANTTAKPIPVVHWLM